ncbi:hypothetical protein INS49_012227 [Diaporthe citri]|uniref:uncharacterized protein n=1 Tax=Diaporthe citri TaxID=83186 RepID=UPI001C820B98|nr:uncharacterized protein INS49_012227 [Diaporthe citri]KAG6358709.1 hypothetical protein INS49_012227 [Diaporthe citri]
MTDRMCLSSEAPHVEGERTKEQADVLVVFLRVGPHWTMPCFLAIKVRQTMCRCSESLLLLSPPSTPGGAEICDDFAFDCVGNAYVAVHSSSVFKITPDGKQVVQVWL